MGFFPKAWRWLRRPLVLAPSAAAVGAAAVICVLGIPQLWTPEAAGWASAVGTCGAVVVALGLALDEARRRRLDAADRARGVSVLLFPTLILWQSRIEMLARHVRKGRTQGVQESFGRDDDDVLAAPPLLQKYLETLYVLGPAAVPLSRVVVGCTFARGMRPRVIEDMQLRPGELTDAVVGFSHRLDEMAANISLAIERMGNYLHTGSR